MTKRRDMKNPRDVALKTAMQIDGTISAIRKSRFATKLRTSSYLERISDQRGDVPGWVLVVLMTTGLVTGIWTVAQPRLSSLLRNSLDNMNSIR